MSNDKTSFTKVTEHFYVRPENCLMMPHYVVYEYRPWTGEMVYITMFRDYEESKRTCIYLERMKYPKTLSQKFKEFLFGGKHERN